MRWASLAVRPETTATRAQRIASRRSASRQAGSTTAADGVGAIWLIVPSMSVKSPYRPSPRSCLLSTCMASPFMDLLPTWLSYCNPFGRPVGDQSRIDHFLHLQTVFKGRGDGATVEDGVHEQAIANRLGTED